jgi:hypothetical protein
VKTSRTDGVAQNVEGIDSYESAIKKKTRKKKAQVNGEPATM